LAVVRREAASGYSFQLSAFSFQLSAFSFQLSAFSFQLSNLKSQISNLKSATIMLKTGILNPQINSLLSRVRHTNTLVIADRGFRFWPMIETIDISLVDGIPSVLEVLRAIRANFVVGKAWMAEEFLEHNAEEVRQAFAQGLSGIPLIHEPHVDFKRRVPLAIGLFRTGDTVQYANLVLESA